MRLARNLPDYGGRQAIARHFTPLIAKALNGSINGLRAAVVAAVNAEGEPKQRAAKAVQTHVHINTKPLANVLFRLYSDAGLRGLRTGVRQVSQAQKGIDTVSDAQTLLSRVDWKNWKPGNANLAKEATPRLRDVLFASEKIADSIGNTTRNKIADAISWGIENGESYSTTGSLIDFVLLTAEEDAAESYRADTIAITETQRAFNEGALDSYELAGLGGWTWLAYDEACDECADNDGQEFAFDDETPPAHPDCRCAVVPLMGDYEEETEE